MPVIKREQITDDAESSPDSAALAEGLRSRIARERVQMRDDTEAQSGTRKGRVLQHEDVADRVQPYRVPVTELESDFPLSQPLDRADASMGDSPNSAPEEASGEDESESSSTRTEAEWEARLEEAVEAARAEGFETGREEGYEQGYADARAELEEEFEAQRQRITKDAGRLHTLWEEFIEESQPHLVESTIDIAETIVDAPLPESIRRISARAIAEAVEELASTPPLTITLHPVDYQHLQETGMLEQINANHEQLRWNTRPELDEGDWSVESPVAMIRHFREELIRTLRTRLGALHDSGPDSPPSDVSDA